MVLSRCMANGGMTPGTPKNINGKATVDLCKESRYLPVTSGQDALQKALRRTLRKAESQTAHGRR